MRVVGRNPSALRKFTICDSATAVTTLRPMTSDKSHGTYSDADWSLEITPDSAAVIQQQQQQQRDISYT